MSFAKALFEAKDRYNFLLCEFAEHMERILVDSVLWDHDSVDSYDGSFELYGCEPTLRVTPPQLAEIWELGFERFWLNHRDGSETSYSRRGSTDGSHRADGLHAALRAGTRAAVKGT